MPNPWGRRDRPAHRQKAEQIAEQLRRKGLRAEFEYAVKVQGGKTRYFDVAGIDPATNKLVEGHQIERTFKRIPKRPVARERRVLKELVKSPHLKGVRIKFYPCND